MRIFGTDGIRGTINNYPMTPEVCLRAGMALCFLLKKRLPHKPKILIGKDTRISGYVIESALTSGITSMGGDVYLVGPIPTPAVAFLVKSMRVDAGIVISASHNPFSDNGIKIFSNDGFKLTEELENDIEKLINDKDFPAIRPSARELGKAYRIEDAQGRYIEFIKSTLPKDSNLEGLKVAIDPANGAAYKITPTLFHELGAEVITINDKPDGVNINKECGALYPESLIKIVKETQAHFGVAHDGDADRTILVDEKGNIVDGDFILTILAEEFKKERKLKKNTVVATIMTNMGVENYLKNAGIKLIRTKVGDKYVVEEMLKGSYNLGGEQSGHIICMDYTNTGDGPITAVQIAYIIKKNQLYLSELIKDIPRYPQEIKSIKIPETLSKDEVKNVIKKLSQKASTLEKEINGRIIIRLSGTEPKIRIMVEDENPERLKQVLAELEAVTNIIWHSTESQ
ncbi:phosphoglucosamine mutase [Thermodesulfovibrio yellowstonii]|uniref:Phosphoglucosamine mutase n=1 Tax=Thermodesulfovibrio yellowstonii TaxID=28262 RepID=A0A9W6GEL4_9BACT|nr:phosphoglucosamine mutase [Thermodesulfovibrio islandicus]GLI52575.1 phosphoglucosamine mutase [Thermodesulfovibrio islandicus]